MQWLPVHKVMHWLFSEVNSIQNLGENIKIHFYFLKPSLALKQFSVNIFASELLNICIGLKTLEGFGYGFLSFGMWRGRR